MAELARTHDDVADGNPRTLERQRADIRHGQQAQIVDDLGQPAGLMKHKVGTLMHTCQMQYVPSVRELGEISQLALRNAANLLDDARILLEAGRYPRALVLATLAAEEFGKHYLCSTAIGFDRDDREYWDGFWAKFNGHEPKLLNWGAHFVDSLGLDDETWQSSWDELAASARAGHRRKMAALYVDFRRGNTTFPDDVITEEATRQTVNAVAFAVEPIVALRSGLNLPDQYDSLAPKFQSLISKMKAAKAARDFDAFRTSIEEFWTGIGMPPEAAEELRRRFDEQEASS